MNNLNVYDSITNARETGQGGNMEYLASRLFTGGRFQWICLADTIDEEIGCLFYEPCMKNGGNDKLWCLHCDGGRSDICTVHKKIEEGT